MNVIVNIKTMFAAGKFICPMLLNSRRKAPSIAGNPTKKEYLKLSLRLIPKISAVIIVIPDREMPGKTASPWAMPIIIAYTGVIYLSDRLFDFILLDIINNNAVRSHVISKILLSSKIKLK